MRLFRGIFSKVDQLLTGRRPVDDDLFDELEELLIQADVSMRTTTRLVDELRHDARRERLSHTDQVKAKLEEKMTDILHSEKGEGLRTAAQPPSVYLIVGVNGVGKTTTIAKLANMLKKQGKKVIVSAADTFRAAAIDQLEIWAGRAGVDIVKHKPGSDPAAVVYDSIQAAKSRAADFVIVDTAGRLHTRVNLMEELKKIGRVIERELGHPADEVLLVLDATTGQNAVSQAKEFQAAVNVTGIALAKLDGTAKGGIVVTIKEELGVPIKLVGLGEGMDDLEPFEAGEFVKALFEGEQQT